MKTTIESVSSLSFSHNREDVDVHLFDKDGQRITTVKKVSADLFLEFFEYGTSIYDPYFYNSQDDESIMRSFLEKIL